MAVPRSRMSNAKKNSRRSHHAKVAQAMTPCTNCSKLRLSHRICPHCGHYKNKAVTQTDEV